MPVSEGFPARYAPDREPYFEGYRGVYMMSRADLGRSVHSSYWAVKPVVLGLSLLLACTAAGTSFLAFQKEVTADEDRKPLAAVSVAAEPLAAVAVAAADRKGAAAPLEAMAVTAEPLEATSVIPEVKRPDSYVNDYLGFTRTDLVSYLVDNADEYLGTPYKEETVAPVLGPDGHMQCEGFIWDVMRAVATQNETDIPCGNIRTEPANGGGWVNWSYYHNVDPITFNTKDEMLASGILEKGDVIWSFDIAGPYGLSNSNHVGFFWGDDPHDDKFWESADATGAEFFAGSADGNRIAGIESMSATPSVWWVFKLSPDNGYDPAMWTGLPSAGVTDPSGQSDEAEEKTKEDTEESTEKSMDEDAEESVEENADKSTGKSGEALSKAEDKKSAENSTPADEYEDNTGSGYESIPAAAGNGQDAGTAAESSESSDTVSSSYTSQSTDEMIFYNGQEEDAGYYASFTTEGDPGYYGY